MTFCMVSVCDFVSMVVFSIVYVFSELPVTNSNNPIEDKEFCMPIDDIDRALGKRTSRQVLHSQNINQCLPSEAEESLDLHTITSECREIRQPSGEHYLERIENKRKYESITVIGYDDDLQAPRQWCDAYYFTDAMKTYLQKIYNTIDDTKALGWPLVMRNRSLIYIGKRCDSEAMCLPAISARLSVSFFSFEYSVLVGLNIYNDNIYYFDSKTYCEMVLKNAKIQWLLSSPIKMQLN